MTRGLVSYLCRVMLNKLKYVGRVTRSDEGEMLPS
jgi:hypothetical protein